MDELARPFTRRLSGVAWPTILLCATCLVAQVAMTWGAVRHHVPVLLVIIGNSLCGYCQWTVTHEAVHRLVARRRWLNDAIGVIAAFSIMGSFYQVRLLHLQHHAHTNDPREDPDFWVVGRSKLSTLLRCATTTYYYIWFYFTRMARLNVDLALTLVTWLAISKVCGWATAAGLGKAVFLYWYVPTQVTVTTIAFVFDYIPHRPHADQDRMRNTVIIREEVLDVIFLYQNLHLLHHLFPGIPWYRYRCAFGSLEPRLRMEGAPILDWRAALDRLDPAWRGP